MEASAIVNDPLHPAHRLWIRWTLDALEALREGRRHQLLEIMTALGNDLRYTDLEDGD